MQKAITYLLTMPPMRRLLRRIAEKRLDNAIDRWGSDSQQVEKAYERVRAADFAARYGRSGSQVVRDFVAKFVDPDPDCRDAPVVPRNSLAAFCQARDIRAGLVSRKLQFRSDREYLVCRILFAASVLVSSLCVVYCLLHVAVAPLTILSKVVLGSAITFAFYFLWTLQTIRTARSLNTDVSTRFTVRQLIDFADALKTSTNIVPFDPEDKE